MTTTDIAMYAALVGEAFGALGLTVVVVIMFRRRAKERRERTAQRVHGQHA
jgi:hypothetical protein